MKIIDMKKREVLIELRTLQTIDSQELPMELITRGSLSALDGKVYLSYNESEITGMQGTFTVVKIDDDKVTIDRRGNNNSQLIFERGKRHHNYYESQFGGVSIAVKTNELVNEIMSEKRQVMIEYDMELNNSLASRNRVYIKVKDI